MSDGPLTASIRHALHEFTRLTAERAACEKSTKEALDGGIAGARREHAEALKAAEEARARAVAEAEGAFAARSREVLGPLDEQLAAAHRQEQAERKLVGDRIAADEAVIEKWLDDKQWMAESIFDNNWPKPAAQFETLRKDLLAIGDELRRIETAARAHLKACRMGAFPAVGSPAGAAGWGEGESSKRLGEMHKGAQDRAAQLGRLVLPRMFMALWPAVVVLVFAGAGVAAGGQLGGWGSAQAMQFGAAAGAVAGLAFLVLAYVLAKGKSGEVASGLAHALAEARAAGERWLEIAGETRRRAEIQIKEARDLEVRSSQVKAAAKRDEIHKAARDKLAAAGQASRAAIAEVSERRRGQAEAFEQERRRALDAAEAEHERASAQAEQRLGENLGALQQRFEADRAALASDWRSGMGAAHGAAAHAHALAGAICPAWTDPIWEREDGPGGWAPRGAAPGAVALGELRLDLTTLPGGLGSDEALRLEGPDHVALPAAMELPNRCSLLLRTGGQGRSEAIATLQSAMLRILTAFPPGKARFTILDPVGLGQNFAAFMHLADYEPALVNDRIWTEPRHIEQRLSDLTEHMENVIQKYLRNQFPTIEEYNAHAGEVAEPYRFLVIADLPAGFNELAGKRLASILDSGPRCGVYVLAAVDTRQALPQGLTAGDLNKCSVQLAWRGGAASAGGGFVREDPDFSKLPLSVEAPPGDELFNRLVHMVGRHAKDSSRVQVPFEMIAPREREGPGGIWSLSSARDVSVAMGRAGATKLQYMTLGRGTAQHALIAGRTGSGKSTLLHAIITNLALWYGPDEVEMYLIDFKKGVEFKTYAAHDVPHARVIAIESEREFGLSVLRRLDSELKQRGELFRAAEAQDIAGYRAKNPGARMPRVLLIVDEFQELFVEDDKLAQESSLLLDRLVRQGRAFGMHAVLGSQTLGGAYTLARSTIGQMAVRIALQCSEADSYLIMSDDNAAARLLSRPGEAIYNDASGAIEGNSPFQVAWLSEEKRDELLGQVRERQRRQVEASGNGSVGGVGAGTKREPPIIFEGSAPAHLERNPLLADVLSGRSTPRPGVHLAWLGEPIAIKEPTAAAFRRQSSSNLLIVGQRDESAMALLAASMVSLGAQVKAGPRSPITPIWVLDGTPADAGLAGYLAQVGEAVAKTGTMVRSVGYREVEAAIGELVAEIERRQKDEQVEGGAVFVIVCGLQRFRMLRRPENEFDFGGSEIGVSPDKLFARVLREGPAVGVHALVWCDTMATLNRTFERAMLREFDQRVLFQMSAADSSSLIDLAAAGLIGANRALFYSEEQGTVEKFRPYALPGLDWVATAGC